MQDIFKYYNIGGWQFLLNESADNEIGCEFLNRLSEFSSESSIDGEICISNHKRASPELEIPQNALSVYKHKDGIFTHEIYVQQMHGYLWAIWMKPRSLYLAYSADTKWRNICLLADKTNTDGLYAFARYADIFSYAVLAHGGIVFHGVVMDYQNRGVILSAPSGTGKTTHSNIWRDLGLSTIINGDRALCRFIDGSWTVFGMPWCGTSGIAENRQVPIHAIVVLEQHSENIVQRLAPLEALTRLLPNTYAPPWEPVLYNKMLDRLDEIIPAVPIFLLRCRPDEDAALTLKAALDSLQG